MMARKKSDKLGGWQLQRWLQNQKRSGGEKGVMKDETRNETSWLPKKKLRNSIHLLTLLALIVFLILTGFFLFMDNISQIKEESSWILKFCLTITSIPLGFCLSLCVDQWKSGNLDQKRAIQIRKEARKQIFQMATWYRRTISEMQYASISNNVEFYKMFLFFLSQRKAETDEFLYNKANEIQELGYDSNGFLEERRVDFQQTRDLADKLVRIIYESPLKDSIPRDFIDGLKFDLPSQNPDKVEQMETSSKIGDDLESET